MKYDVKMSCGHVEEVALFGKNSEREQKIKYFESSGLCRECYKRKMQEKEAKEPLTFHSYILPHVNYDNGEILLAVWFSGNTMPVKDEIKKLKYHWGRVETESFDNSDENQLKWNKIIDLSELTGEIEKAKAIGAEKIKKTRNRLNYSIAMDAHRAWHEKEDAINALERPECPPMLIGHKWNGKVYGSKKNGYSVYLDGEKVSLSEEETPIIQKYAEEKEAYLEKVKELELGK